MRLTLLTDGWREPAKAVKPLLGTMPKHKRAHSRRVGRTLHQAGVPEHGVYAGLLHDYLERGGDLEHLSNHVYELGLPPSVMAVVQSLTSDEKHGSGAGSDSGNEPLDHLSVVLAKLPTTRDGRDLGDLICLVKLADRIDNLEKRLLQSGKIGKSYRAKSIDLIDYLILQYRGARKPFKRLLRRFNDLIDS